MKRARLAGLVLVLLGCRAALATGLLLPSDRSLPPLAIKNQRVSVAIRDQVATTHVKQIFLNSVDRDLEAVYVFPLPRNAAISEFAMLINGKRVQGELLEKQRAAQIYRDIVSRMKDPGLLEYMGGNLLRIRVYPVPRKGEQFIEVKYTQLITLDAGIGRYVYPLRTGQAASRTLEDFSLAAALHSRVPIKTVYSPTHKVSISRKSDREALVGFEEERSLLDRDFVLYYTISEKDFGLNLLTYRKEGQDGFFMLMIAPKVEVSEGDIIDKDMCFVIDTSGSMAGEKIARAKEALKYCVRSLGKGDRFNIIRFSTDVEAMAEQLAPASAGAKAAVEFVDRIEARGGTNIDGALALALKHKVDPKRPYTVVFLTDGKPTVGETNLESIVKNVGTQNTAGARVFVFGVGDSVNTHLLDRVSQANRGYSEYVKPDEEIEQKVSLFYNKASKPVMANVSVDLGKLKTRDRYPQAMSDLFHGMQLTLLGRYSGQGDFAIRLAGDVRGAKREFVYEGTFPAVAKTHDFIPRLWAQRKIGYLLDEIRLHGETKELKDEVIRLSKEHGIATPYTSYLVLEDSDRERLTRHDRRLGGRARVPMYPTAPPTPRKGAGGRDLRGYLMAPGARPEAAAEAEATIVADAMKRESGKAAVQLSKRIARLKQSAERDAKDDAALLVRTVSGREFRLVDEVWTEAGIKPKMEVVEVEYGSDAYFALFAAKPEWKAIFQLGPRVAFVANGRVVRIDDKGRKTLPKSLIEELVK